LKEKVDEQERSQTDLQRKLGFEVENGEKLEATIATLTNKNLLLREEQQRLHLIGVELKAAQATIKQQEEHEQKVENLQQENSGLRKSNIILTEQLEVFEKCNNRFKLEIERQKSQSSTSRPCQAQLLIPPAASNLSAHINAETSHCVDRPEYLIRSSKQQASQLQAHIHELDDPHTDTNVNMPSLSPSYIGFESTKERP